MVYRCFVFTRILKPQKKAIRIIVKGSFYTHSDPKFNILKVNDIHLHQQLKCYFKLINNILPDHFYDFNLALNSDIHDYNTRGKNKLRNAHVKHEFACNCIRNQMPHLLNTTHLAILEKVLTHSLIGFGQYTKHYLIDKYSDICLIHYCYFFNLTTPT